MTTLEMRQKRGELLAQARQVLADAEKEKRSKLNTEEDARYVKIMKDYNDLGVQLKEELTGIEARKAELDKEDEEMSQIVDRPLAETRGNDGAQLMPYRGREFRYIPTELRRFDGTAIDAKTAKRHIDLFNKYLMLGEKQMHSTERDELRAMEAGLATAGGFLQPTQQMSGRLIQNVDDATFMLGISAVETLTQAESLGIVSLASDPDDFDWTTELLTGSESEVTFGKRELRPHPLAKRCKISRTLLRKSSRDPVAIVNQRFAYKLAVTIEKAGLTGTGLQRPLGVFVASNDGIPTTRDVSTDNTGTAITPDGLKSAKFFLKAQYWPRAQWIFHRDAISMIAKLKDGEGRYIFDDGTQLTPMGRLLGFPVNISEHAPNTFTTGLYVGLLGDFGSGYQWAIALAQETRRLDELYALTDQVGFIWRGELDGMPVLPEAFARVKLG